jgi:hypothetical protein
MALAVMKVAVQEAVGKVLMEAPPQQILHITAHLEELMEVAAEAEIHQAEQAQLGQFKYYGIVVRSHRV